jgi:hypothetical protein
MSGKSIFGVGHRCVLKITHVKISCPLEPEVTNGSIQYHAFWVCQHHPRRMTPCNLRKPPSCGNPGNSRVRGSGQTFLGRTQVKSRKPKSGDVFGTVGHFWFQRHFSPEVLWISEGKVQNQDIQISYGSEPCGLRIQPYLAEYPWILS